MESDFLDLETSLNCGGQLWLVELKTENFLWRRLPNGYELKSFTLTVWHWMTVEGKISWFSMRFNIIWLLVEEKGLKSFVEWWVSRGHMTQIILTSSLQTIWWKYWPSTCVSGEMNDFLFFFFWNFQQLSYRCEVVFHVKSVEKNTINKRICVATLNVIFLRVVNYWALHKLCNSNKTSDILCAVTFQDCSYY